jgi:hypothetical protein
MRVNKARRDYQVRRVDNPLRTAGDSSDLNDPAVGNSDI